MMAGVDIRSLPTTDFITGEAQTVVVLIMSSIAREFLAHDGDSVA